MRGSRNLRQGRGGGGGGPRQSDKKALTTLLVCFFAFYLVLSLFYRSQMVNFKEKFHFSRFRRGSKFVQGGGGPTFPSGGGGGVELLIPYRNPYNLWFSRGIRTPCPPPSGSALGCDLFSFPVRKMMRSPLVPVLAATSLYGFSRAPSYIFCNSSLLSSITQKR